MAGSLDDYYVTIYDPNVEDWVFEEYISVASSHIPVVTSRGIEDNDELVWEYSGDKIFDGFLDEMTGELVTAIGDPITLHDDGGGHVIQFIIREREPGSGDSGEDSGEEVITKLVSLDNLSVFLGKLRLEYALKSDIGILNNLTTESKTSVVSAINELKNKIANI